MSYKLTVPSLRFAGFLTSWAIQYDIPIIDRTRTIDHRKRPIPVLPNGLPVILEFESAADRAELMQIARAKIAELRLAERRSKGQHWARRDGPGPLNLSIAARLQADYEAMS